MRKNVIAILLSVLMIIVCPLQGLAAETSLQQEQQEQAESRDNLYEAGSNITLQGISSDAFETIGGSLDPYRVLHISDDDFSMAGISYSGYKFIMGYNGLSNGNTAEINYNLNGKCSSMTFKAGYISGTRRSAYLTIITDGNVIYDSQEIKYTDLPKTYEIKLNKVKQLTIRFRSDGYDRTFYGIGDIHFIQNEEFSTDPIGSNMENTVEPYSYHNMKIVETCKMGGNTYTKAIYSSTGYDGTGSGWTGEVIFNFQGASDSMVFYIGNCDRTSTYTKDAALSVTADGKEVVKQTIPWNSVPQKISVNLKGVEQLIIRVVTEGYDRIGYGIGGIRILPEPNHWEYYNGKAYWYENGIRQGTSSDPKGVYWKEDPATNRGREIYDSETDGWYWLDAAYNGAKAEGKEVFMPYVHQQENEWDDAEMRAFASSCDAGMQDYVYRTIKNHTGKWVRYDENGKMLKGWVKIEGALEALYPNQTGNTYYYDYKTGLMAKGWINIDGNTYHFDETTGVLLR